MCCWHYTYVGRNNSLGTETGFGLDGPGIESAKVYGMWGGSKRPQLDILTIFELNIFRAPATLLF